jgi:hypothetical protein
MDDTTVDKPNNSDVSETEKNNLKTKKCPKCGKIMYSNQPYFSNRRFCSKICRQLFCSNAYYHKAKKNPGYRAKRKVYFKQWYESGNNKIKMRDHMREYMRTEYKNTPGYKKLLTEPVEVKNARKAKYNKTRRVTYIKKKYGPEYVPKEMLK